MVKPAAVNGAGFGLTEAQFTAFLLDDLESAIEAEGAETIAMLIMEPVQNAGGSFTPPEGYWRGVRELCTRYDILLCADEVITGFGRLGAWFGSERYDIRPDLLLFAKGVTSGYVPLGGVIAAPPWVPASWICWFRCSIRCPARSARICATSPMLRSPGALHNARRAAARRRADEFPRRSAQRRREGRGAGDQDQHRRAPRPQWHGDCCRCGAGCLADCQR